MGSKIKMQRCEDAKMQRGKEIGEKRSKLKKIKYTVFLFFLLLTLHSSQLTTYAQGTNPIVRVAISNSGFKSFVYSETAIVATAQYNVYDKNSKQLIAKLETSDVLKIKDSADGFELSSGAKSIAKKLKTTVVVDCPKGLVGVQNLKRNGKQALYHGTLEITPKNDTSFYIVNHLDLQDYLKGVVPNEMPVRFGLEALKAQAVAARNYVLQPRIRAYKEFDVDDSVASQVYFGANSEASLSNQAVSETEGLVALYDWEPILAQYSSTAGGYTESYENAFSDPRTKEFPAKTKPYLKGRPDILSVANLNREEEARIFYMGYPDSYDMKSPYYRWQRTWDATELHDVLAKTLIDQSKTGFVKPAFKDGDVLGEIKELRVPKRGVSGKIMELEIVTDTQTYKVYKELVVRRLLQSKGVSLPSANVVFENLYDADKKLNKVVAYGGGFGHGVGMSQFGAGFMATSLHKPFDKILKRYYTGISITTCPEILSSSDTQKVIIEQFFAPQKKAFLVVDNKYQIEEFSAIINGRTVAIELEKSFLPIRRISRIDISSYVKQGKNTAVFKFPQNCANKAIRFYIELVESDSSEYNF